MPSAEFLAARERFLRDIGREDLLDLHERDQDDDSAGLTGTAYLDFLAEQESSI